MIDQKVIDKIPEMKISNALLEFANPYIQMLPQNFQKSKLESIILTAITVWNACNFDACYNTNEYKTMVKNTMINETIHTIKIIDFLIDRKQKLYKDDIRCIFTHHITMGKNGNFSLKVESKLPPDKP